MSAEEKRAYWNDKKRKERVNKTTIKLNKAKKALEKREKAKQEREQSTRSTMSDSSLYRYKLNI